MSRSRALPVFVLLSALFGLGAWAMPAHATIVERVVAVVGDHPILLSDLRSRARAFEGQLGGAAADRAAQRSQLYSQMLDRMVDEELLRRAASQAKLTVSEAEVDGAVERVARGNNVTVEQLLVEVERSGISAMQYRRELRAQLLDAKVMNTRMQGRVTVSPEDAREEYRRLQLDERQTLPMELALIRMQVPTTATPEQAKELERLAVLVSERAQRGEAFDALSRQYSTDPDDRASGGAIGEITPRQMTPELLQPLLALEAGGVTKPIWSQNTWVVLKLVRRAPSQLPSYEQAEMQLVQRVQARKMEKLRRRWLDDMRKRTHVELRL